MLRKAVTTRQVCAMTTALSPGVISDAETFIRQEARILLVDDDPDAIRLMHQMLQGYRHVRFATRVHDAMQLIEREAPDVVLLDAEMPESNGFALCERLKQQAHTREIPVLFVTAHTDVSFEVRALSCGAADFITKPISAPVFQLRVAHHLRTKRQMDLLRQLATIDPLTALPNAQAFQQMLRQEWRHSELTQRPLSLLVIDLDQFRKFNWHQGHQEGDRRLQATAEVLQAQQQACDTVARVGGDEFAWLMPGSDAQTLQERGEALQAALRSQGLGSAEGQPGGRTVCAGGSARQASSELWGLQDHRMEMAGSSHTQLLDAAQRSLTLARQQGRGRLVTVALHEAQRVRHAAPHTLGPVEHTPASQYLQGVTSTRAPVFSVPPQ
ncbi:diguanylate cyclase [Aquabacterium lacunae]|uniref:diguanylate cyclase n=2 Tax=Aquabacterium lacunae TaxID=2528630 RepID=A0A4V2JG16_9BURK|nr:diguanylate cyclase [Aquabacterium lacunae]